MPRHLPGLALWLAAAAPAACAAEPAPASPAITISYAEQPARLVRDTSFYSAGRGVALRDNDILASNSGAIQLDAGGATVAIGPASRVFVKGASAGELVLLDGWLKVRGRPQRPISVGTALLRITSAGATATLHGAATETAVFAESGELPVETAIAGKAPRRTTLASEQFAVAGSKLPLRVAARPSPAFLAAMPASFRDALVAVAPKGAVAPGRERAASYAELAPWLSAQPALRQAVQRRFQPPRTGHAAPVRPSPALFPAQP